MYLVPELLEEIFLRLPLKSIVKFRTVSKQWRSILESPRFAERRRIMNAQTKMMIMAAGDRTRVPRGFKGDEEFEIVNLQCDVASRPSLSCDGLVCIPVPGWVNVFNPSTGQFLRFSSGRDPPIPSYANHFLDGFYDVFPGCWSIGFGRDNVSGSYKIVRMCFNHYGEIHRCEILDVNIGRWQKLSPPPYEIGYTRKSTCVNGSIYWVKVTSQTKLLALDLHTQEWRDVGLPLGALGTSCHVANLEDRLALASTYIENGHWNVKIWSMEAIEETWSVIYSMCLFPLQHHLEELFPLWFWTRPVAVSKKGNLFFQDSYKSLFKYYPETGEVRCLAAEICVISPFVENLVPLGRLDTRKHGLEHLDHVPLSSRISNFFRRMELKSPSILVITTVVTLVMFTHWSHLSRS